MANQGLIKTQSEFTDQRSTRRNVCCNCFFGTSRVLKRMPAIFKSSLPDSSDLQTRCPFIRCNRLAGVNVLLKIVMKFASFVCLKRRNLLLLLTIRGFTQRDRRWWMYFKLAGSNSNITASGPTILCTLQPLNTGIKTFLISVFEQDAEVLTSVFKQDAEGGYVNQG